MNLYRPVLFVHLTAVIGIFAALAIEWVTALALRRATSYDQARDWTRVWDVLPAIGAPSLLGALASGVYLATSLGLWSFGWVAVAIPTLIGVGVAGALTAPARKRTRATLAAHLGQLPNAVQVQLRQTLWLRSLRVRTALLLGLVFEMTLKPDAGAWVMAAVVVIGIAWAAATRTEAAEGPQTTRATAIG